MTTLAEELRELIDAREKKLQQLPLITAYQSLRDDMKNEATASSKKKYSFPLRLYTTIRDNMEEVGRMLTADGMQWVVFHDCLGHCVQRGETCSRNCLYIEIELPPREVDLSQETK